MNRVWKSPLALLLISGILLGAIFPLGRLAAEAGVSPAAWSFLIAAGTGTVLTIAMLAGGHRIGMRPDMLRFYVLAGLISNVLPNMLVFSAMPHLGSGYTGIFFTLSPVITLALSVLFRIKGAGLLALAGIAVGFAGALTVALTRGEAGNPASLGWVFIGLLIPLTLASGNIYRTIAWPKDAGPIELAAGSQLASALLLLAYGALPGAELGLGGLAGVPGLAALQVAASAGMFVFFFRLQAVGGPVYLSQIGYVAAAVGLFTGTVFLAERYGWVTWAGAGVITVGVALTTIAQLRTAR